MKIFLDTATKGCTRSLQARDGVNSNLVKRKEGIGLMRKGARQAQSDGVR
jgi:hypothetical protein